ncbi:substrate-binding domain-containing protein [Salibacterium halotolerans]|uniref:Ribose transport system substrate-binding protein n=1 Tax=Salibacterium halotolerans TaxID=1884432 RepID=A0A1I5V9K0_9BACI|nr:substrate-binding domain-containing protein [Salibacterium halotolerans]SFQ04193.1 ribose transport system substrate-binding protein [Salibacterium halotolerans]
MKKVLLLVLVMLVPALAAACGNSESNEEAGGSSGDGGETSEGSGSSGGEDLTIGISLPSATHGWMGALIDNAESKAQEIEEASGVEYIMTNAEDPNTQANDVNNLISQDVDAIVMLPIESAALSPVGQQVKEADIPLVVVDRELDNDAADVVVKGDNQGIGANAGEYFIEQLNGEGKVVEITGPPNSVTEQRGSGFQEAVESEDGMEIVASQSGDFSKEKSLEVMQNILQAQPEIDAVFTQDDGMALGVQQAVKEAGRDDIQFITGAGGSKEVFENIRDGGLIQATFLYAPTMVRDGVQIAADIAQGEEPEESMVIKEATQVTEENVDEFYNPDSKY